MSVSKSGSTQQYVPSGLDVFANASATNGSGSWAEVIASTSTSILVWGCFAVSTSATSSTGFLKIGTGAAAAEVACFTAAFTRVGTGGSAIYPLAIPIRVPSGTRVAMFQDGTPSLTTGIYYTTEGAVVA